jgi:uncharacterized phage protein gp47/JayE
MSLSDPYVRPTLTALRAQALQDINASDLPGVDGLLTKAVLRVMAWVMAGFAWLHYDYLDFIYQQSNPWSATGAAALGWGGLVRVTPKDATVAGADGLGLGAFPASPVGTPLPAGTPVYRLDGFEYTTSAEAFADGTGNVTAPLLATIAGSTGNAAAGTVLRLGSSISGITSTGSVTAPIVDGADQETPAAFQARYLQQFAAPAQGGDAADYINFALAVPGVTRAWVAPNYNGAGTVAVWTMFDVAEAATGGFPVGSNGVATGETRATVATGDQLTVANAIYPLRPVTALVYSNGPINQPVNFTIANLLPNTTAMQAAIRAALTDMFLRLGQVGGSIDPSAMTEWGPIYQSDWDEAIDAVPGLIHCTVTAPTAPITPAVGALFTMGTLSASP